MNARNCAKQLELLEHIEIVRNRLQHIWNKNENKSNFIKYKTYTYKFQFKNIEWFWSTLRLIWLFICFFNTKSINSIVKKINKITITHRNTHINTILLLFYQNFCVH